MAVKGVASSTLRVVDDFAGRVGWFGATVTCASVSDYVGLRAMLESRTILSVDAWTLMQVQLGRRALFARKLTCGL